MPPTFRPGVGIMLINRGGQVWLGRRTATRAWQMLEGEIHRGESPHDALLREIREEIGTNDVEMLAEGDGWRSQTEANDASEASPPGLWRGQRQKWFLCLFKGGDSDVNAAGGASEFDAWCWVPPAELARTAAASKRQLYANLLEEFASCIEETAQRLRAQRAEPIPSATLIDLDAHRDAASGSVVEPEVDDGPLHITDGEVNFIEGFVHDGSIGAECGLQLMRYWGYCERHAWVSLAVEMSVLHGFCSRSATLYVDILRQATVALAPAGRKKPRHLVKSLKETGGCIICSARPRLRGVVERAELAKAKNPTRLRALAEQTARYWRPDCCPRCVDRGLAGGHLCRRHLIEAIESGVPVDLDFEHHYLLDLLARLDNFAWSFSWGFRGIDGVEDRAALLAAIGWCSGWASLGRILPLHFPTAISRTRLEQI